MYYRKMSTIKNLLTFSESIESDEYVYYFTFYYKTSNGTIRKNHHCMGLIEKSTPLKDLSSSALIKLNLIPLNKSFFNCEKIDYYCIVWSQSGTIKGKITQTVPKIIKRGVYEDTTRSDKTNVFMQGMKEMKRRFSRETKKNKKYLKDENITETLENHFNESEQIFDFQTDWKISVPLLHKYEDYKSKITFPCYIQGKVDGNRLIAIYHPNIPEQIYGDNTYEGLGIFTRSKKNYNIPKNCDIPTQLLKLTSKYPGVYLDGEIGNLNYTFQEITGTSRRKNKVMEIELYYYIFDCFIFDQPTMPFEERIEFLRSIITESEFKNLILLNTETCETFDDLNRWNEYFLNENYEGSVVKMRESVYEYDKVNSKRLQTTLKWKPFFDAEWKVVDYECARGNHNLAIKWKCVTDDGKVFGVNFDKSVFTINERMTIYTYLQEHPEYFNAHFKNKLITIKYNELTKDGIPIRGGCKTFRDTTIQNKIYKILNTES